MKFFRGYMTNNEFWYYSHVMTIIDGNLTLKECDLCRLVNIFTDCLYIRHDLSSFPAS